MGPRCDRGGGKRGIQKGPSSGDIIPEAHLRGFLEDIDMDADMTAVKTGTSTIGICFDGGVVVGADHRATMGHFVANKSVQKLFKIADNLALTTAGLVGHAQSLSRTLAAEMSLFELTRGQQMSVKGAATMTANILVGRPHWVQLLIAGYDSTGGSVYSIDSAGGSIPDEYCATGSGSPYMYGVLEDQFKPGMTEKEALKVAAKSLLASAQRDAASGNGMDLAVITEKGYRPLDDVELEALLKQC
ncbi:MAG: proteasome subunit beta [Candidatus Thalassarchaeaceae archaeon]|nr:proteasome subunit beta [Candidatus Thalassarchaeaceae archaeon]